MGSCTSSKATDAKDQNEQPSDKPKFDPITQETTVADSQGGATTGIWVSEEEATECVVNELGTTDSRAKKIVDQITRNDDGKVSNDELVALWVKIKEIKAQIRVVFEKMDKDNSGSVTPEEAVVVVSGWFNGLPLESIQAMVNRFDFNENGTIQYDEFVYFYSNMVAKRESLTETFEQESRDKLPAADVQEILIRDCALEDYMARSLVEDCDVNKDGLIDRKEFSRLLHDMFGSLEGAPQQ